MISSTKNETVKGIFGLGWGRKKRMMSLASEVFPSDAYGTAPWRGSAGVESRVLEPKREHVSGARDVGIAGIQMGVQVIKHMGLLTESTEYRQKREQTATP